MCSSCPRLYVFCSGLELVRHMPRLEELDLSDTTVGNAGVSLLPRYTRRLRSLHLSYSGEAQPAVATPVQGAQSPHDTWSLAWQPRPAAAARSHWPSTCSLRSSAALTTGAMPGAPGAAQGWPQVQGPRACSSRGFGTPAARLPTPHPGVRMTLLQVR